MVTYRSVSCVFDVHTNINYWKYSIEVSNTVQMMLQFHALKYQYGVISCIIYPKALFLNVITIELLTTDYWQVEMDNKTSFPLIYCKLLIKGKSRELPTFSERIYPTCIYWQYSGLRSVSNQIATTRGFTSVRKQSNAVMSDWCLINGDPRVFALWKCSTAWIWLQYLFQMLRFSPPL